MYLTPRLTEIVSISSESKEVEIDSFMEIKFDRLQPRYKVNLSRKAECRPQCTGYVMCLARLHQRRSITRPRRKYLAKASRRMHVSILQEQTLLNKKYHN